MKPSSWFRMELSSQRGRGGGGRPRWRRQDVQKLVGRGSRTQRIPLEWSGAAKVFVRSVRMAGQVCRVAGSVSPGLVHPPGSGGLVQAEGFGEDGGRHLGGEVEERGPAAGPA